MKFFNYAALIVVVPAVLACNGTTQPLSELPTPTATAAPPPTATPEPTATPTPIPTPSVTPEPESLPKTLSGIRPLSVNSDSDAEEILNAALEAMDNLDSLHFSLQAEVGITSADLTATFPFAFEGDYQAPDRMKGKLALSLGFFALEMEIINIGPDTYTTDPQTGLWQQTDDNAAGGVSPTEIIGLANDFGADGLSVVGEETLGDGTAVVHLVGVFSESSDDGPDRELRTDIYIGLEDSLLRRVVVEGAIPLDPVAIAKAIPGLPVPLGDVNSTGDATIFMTSTFSAFNVPVEIEAPVP